MLLEEFFPMSDRVGEAKRSFWFNGGVKGEREFYSAGGLIRSYAVDDMFFASVVWFSEAE